MSKSKEDAANSAKEIHEVLPEKVVLAKKGSVKSEEASRCFPFNLRIFSIFSRTPTTSTSKK